MRGDSASLYKLIDDQAGLELFKRAIGQRDEAAWRAIVEIYRGLLLSQARRQVVRALVVEDDGFCVDRAFQRFWLATRSGRITHCDDLAAVLKYLKMCLGSVLLDEARARRREASTSIDNVAPGAYCSADPSGQAIGRIAARELWGAIDGELCDTNERLVAHLSFVAGLRPREIMTRFPDRFVDVFEVHRVKRTVIERLQRSQTVQHLLE